MEDLLHKHRRIYKVCRQVILPYVRVVFNYRYDKIPETGGPYLLLANHNTDSDPLFLTAASKRHCYFVATEKITRMGFTSWFVMHHFKPIVHYKGKLGVSSVKEILQTLKSGSSVALFPEGNRSFNGLTGDFVASTGKLAKRSGAWLITYALSGGYFTSPRWGSGTRRGKMQGKLIGVYSPEQLKGMSEDEVNSRIKEDLSVDAYADQAKEKTAYYGFNTALGIESTLYMCPECGRIGALRSRGNKVFCECGFKAKYSRHGYLESASGREYTITELDARQRQALRELADCAQEGALFSDSVVAEDIGPDHRAYNKARYNLRAYKDRLELGGRLLLMSEISGMAINQRNLLIIHYNDGEGHLELKGNVSFSALKYLYLYNYVSGNAI